MSDLPCMNAAALESIAKVLGDTATGLTGSEIGHILRTIGVRDVEPDATKWKRLHNALVVRQNQDRTCDRVLSFISRALSPIRYTGQEELFQSRRRGVNVTLAFYGLEYTEEGKFRRCTPALTLSEAESRADRLRAALQRRDVETEVLSFCRAELLETNCFHAVLEATKSVAAKIRTRTGL